MFLQELFNPLHTGTRADWVGRLGATRLPVRSHFSATPRDQRTIGKKSRKSLSTPTHPPFVRPLFSLSVRQNAPLRSTRVKCLLMSRKLIIDEFVGDAGEEARWLTVKIHFFTNRSSVCLMFYSLLVKVRRLLQLRE